MDGNYAGMVQNLGDAHHESWKRSRNVGGWPFMAGRGSDDTGKTLLCVTAEGLYLVFNGKEIYCK
jgi:hypothetical protein